MRNIKRWMSIAILILLLVSGISYVYQTPFLVKQDCNSIALYRYHFGIYQVDRDPIFELHRYKKVYGWKQFLGIAPILCTEQIEYDKCVIEEKQAALNAEQENKQWVHVRDNLYVNAHHQLALKFPYANRCSHLFSEHVQPSKSLSMFSDRFYTHFGFGGNSELSLTGTIDSSTFKKLSPSNFYQDKRHVYRYFNMLDGGNFSILEDADPKTFKLLGDCYAKDRHHIYEERFGQLKGADYVSFKSSTDVGCIAKDKKGYWFWDERKSWDDLDSEERERVSVLEH